MHAGDFYEIEVQCKIDEEVGRFDTDLFFNLQMKNAENESFQMLRLLTCVRSSTLIEEIQPTSAYKKREAATRYETNFHVAGEKLKITG